MKKFLWSTIVYLLALAAAPVAAAQAVVIQGERSPGIYGNVPVDSSNYLFVNCPGCTGAAAPTGLNNADNSVPVGTGLAGGQNFLYGYDGTNWDRLRVDGSANLNVNCASGCAGGTFNNNADAVATSATNGQTAAWLYGWNGASWDRLQVDASKFLKVAVQNSVTVANAGTFAVQAAQSGTWNITNVSGTVSLPTGASTSAKQPALGTAGTASTDVITVQGIASMTKLLVTPDSVALPANQSVNINQVGGTAVVADPCQAIAKTNVAVSQATSTQIITGTSSKKTYICSIMLVAGAAENIAVTAGTGSVCATGASAIIGSTTVANGLVLAANGGFSHGSGVATVASGTVNADNVCILQSGSVRVSGVITYVQQ